MWNLTVRSPLNALFEYEVKSGKNTLGRKPDNHIIIADESASREHAEIYCENDTAVISDLGSLNGTFVNRERITEPHVLRQGDQIRIGQHIITVAFKENGASPKLVAALSGTRPLTRDLMLESIDQNAVFMEAVASRLTTILDLEAGLREIAELTKSAVGATKCEVILAERFDRLDDLELPGSILRRSVDARSVVIIPDLAVESDQSNGGDPEHLIRSVLCVPVIIEQAVAGLICAYKIDAAARTFDSQDVQLLVTSSHLAALTVQRGKLLEKAQVFERLAFTDSLTNVHNRRHFLNLAKQEFQRAKRYQHPLTMLILDLDGLKLINDTHGHLAGDRALQTVADNMKKELREVDFVGRFGGDEFVILLTETHLDGGRSAAERIRQDISATPIDTPEGPLNITVSVGLATLDEKSKSLTDLINQADVALIRAKKAGKNQVAVAD